MLNSILPFGDQNGQFLRVSLIVLLLLYIITALTVIEPKLNQALEVRIFPSDFVQVDLWSLSHLLFYMYLGAFFPCNVKFAFLLSLLFELFEDFTAADNYKTFIKCGDKKEWWQKTWCSGSQDAYWYAKYSDIAVNMTGYLIGVFIMKKYVKSI